MDKKKKVPVIAISVGMAEMPKGKKGPMKMAMGGMANGKKHMYLNEGALVTENLKRLENYLFNAEAELIRAMKSADAKLSRSSTAEQTLSELDKILKLIKKYFVYFMVYNDLEIFFQENNFRFLEDVRIRR